MRFPYLIIGMIGLALAPGSAIACSCVDVNVQEIADSSKHIFVVEILAAKKNPEADSHWENVVATVEILDVVKGSPEELRGLFSGYGGGDCGVPFLVGFRMLVYTNDGIVTSCGATRMVGPFEDYTEYVELLKLYIEDGKVFDFDDY